MNMTKKLSLLEQAKRVSRSDKRLNNINLEEIELAIAWLTDEISLTAVAKVLGKTAPGAAVSRLAILLREAYRAGILRIRK